MDLSSTPSSNMAGTATKSTATATTITSPSSSILSNNSIYNDTGDDSTSLYDSAMDNNMTTFVSFSESANNNSSLLNSYATVDNNSTSSSSTTPHTSLHSTTASDILNTNSILSASTLDLDTTSSNNTTSNTLNGSNSSSNSIPSPTSNVSPPADNLPEINNDFGPHSNYKPPSKYHSNNINSSITFIQSESSSDTNTSQEEVDPKSQLANKTIFKTNNPNLSIIEINENSIKDIDDNSVFIIDDDDDNSLEHGLKKNMSTAFDAAAAALTSQSSTQPQPATPNQMLSDAAVAEKRRKKAESLIQTSKQKLNIAIAEASAAESASPAAVADDSAVVNNGIILPQTKREIKIYDTLAEFEKNLPSTVTVLDTPFGSKVYLVGTAHFSEESQDDVSFVIRNVRPDVVMVELCPSRIPILKLDEKTLLEEAKNFNIAKIRGIIQSHGYINGIFFILLLQMSAQIAKDLGMAPGGEFRRAFEEIHKLPGCMLHLGDRPIRITLHRALKALSLWQTIKLVWRLTYTGTISIEEVEECKQRDLLEKLMQEMAGEFPAFSDVFVKERDLFLCHSLQLSSLPQPPIDGSMVPRPVRVVGVVGIGHANGIEKIWGRVDPQTIPAIMEIPPASLSTRICKNTIKYGLISLTLLGAFKILRPRMARFF